MQELLENQFKIKNQQDSVGGSLQKYANPSLIEDEDRGWKEHLAEKHKI